MKVRTENIEKLALSVRVNELVPYEGDILVVLLKGHLIIEEQLYAALISAVPCPEYIAKANLRFSQMLQLVQAHYKVPRGYWVWDAVAILNKARNELAHQIEPVRLNALVSEFIQKMDMDSSHYRTLEEQLHVAIAVVASCIQQLHVKDT